MAKSHGARRRVPLLLALGLVAATTPFVVVQPSPAAASGERVPLGVSLAPPASVSTSGDFATDTFSDPWDFSNDEDVRPVADAGFAGVPQSTINRSAAGVLAAQLTGGDVVRFVMDWPGVLPWGHDGWAHPIDAATYTRFSIGMYSDTPITLAVRFYTSTGAAGMSYFDVAAGWGQYAVSLLDRSTFRNGTAAAPWAGTIVRLELSRELSDNPANVQLDWARLHTARSADAPPTGVPVPKLLTPSSSGGADYATDILNNPWDFAGMDDVKQLVQVSGAHIEGADLVGTTTGNDPSILLPVFGAINAKKYHRLTVDVCYDGGFGLSGAPGGGMNGRLYWGDSEYPDGKSHISQDFVVFPGCQSISIDLATIPPAAVNEENTAGVGWTGGNHLRFDFDEDPGQRNIRLANIKLAADASFSTSYPITFQDMAGVGGTADVYASTTQGSYTGTKIGTVAASGGVTTFNWNGTDATGALMPSGTYWIWVATKNGNNVGSAFASGPLKYLKPIPSAPSYYVPLTPARLLDTRDGTGGYSAPLTPGGVAEVQVTGNAGVPTDNVTAVVMNVTVDTPFTAGFLTAYPSDQAQPVVSNLNFVPGQTVPNLVTVKIGADGGVNLFNSGASTNVIADIAGYYTTVPQNTGKFTAVTPFRLLDTRDGTGRGGAAAPVGPGQTIDLTVVGAGGVPASGVSSVALNVTVDQPTGSGFLTVYPTGEAKPTASTHNFVPGLTVANMVIAKVGMGGKVSIFNFTGDTHVVADVVGYFSAAGGLFVPIAPLRLVDTRENKPTTALGQAASYSMPIATGSPVPTSAKAAVVNVTSVNSTLPSFVTVWPTGQKRPLASTMNPRPGVPVPNQAYLLTGTGGALDVYNNSGSTDVIIDIFGYIS